MASKKFETVAQKTVLVERRTKIVRAIGKIRSQQAIYMPGALQYLSKRVKPNEVEHAENTPIVFPSTLPSNLRESGCRKGLVEIERQLREAQLRGSLNSLRTHLHMKSRLLTYRGTTVRGQGMLTKSKALMERNQKQIHGDAGKYREAWEAMSRLCGDDGPQWKKLGDNDVRMMNGEEDRALGKERKRKGKKRLFGAAEPGGEEEEEGREGEGDETRRRKKLEEARRAVGEGTRHTSWIWMEGGTGQFVDAKVLDDIVRVEWSKTHARSERWQEETELLREEMRRCAKSLRYNAKEWIDRMLYEGPLAEGKDAAHMEGAAAYAASQAAVYRGICTAFERLWASSSEVTVVPEVGIDDGLDSASEGEDEEDLELEELDMVPDIPEDE